MYQNKNLSIKCEDSKKLEKLIKSSFKKKISIIDKQKKNYFLNSAETKKIIKKITKFIES